MGAPEGAGAQEGAGAETSGAGAFSALRASKVDEVHLGLLFGVLARAFGIELELGVADCHHRVGARGSGVHVGGCHCPVPVRHTQISLFRSRPCYRYPSALPFPSHPHSRFHFPPTAARNRRRTHKATRARRPGLAARRAPGGSVNALFNFRVASHGPLGQAHHFHSTLWVHAHLPA